MARHRSEDLVALFYYSHIPERYKRTVVMMGKGGQCYRFYWKDLYLSESFFLPKGLFVPQVKALNP